MPKSAFASEELARNKLLKDLAKLYDYILEGDLSLKNTSQLILKILLHLEVFKEPEKKQNETGVSPGAQKTRKDIEVDCLQAMWELLTKEQKEVEKENIVNLLHTLLTMDETLPINDKLQKVQNSVKLQKVEEETMQRMTKMIAYFTLLSKEFKTSRFVTHFATNLKPNNLPTEEIERQKCSFAPQICKNSKKMDIERQKGKLPPEAEEKKFDSKEVRDIPTKKIFHAEKRSVSPPRHEMLYENYKEIKKNLQKKEEVLQASKEKELTFKPKISKKAEKIQEDDASRVLINFIISRIV